MLAGANSEQEAAQLKNDVTSVLSKHRFTLRKRKSNFQQLGDRTQSISFSDQPNRTQVLGLLWDPVNDFFHFNVNIPTERVYIKRTILSIISRIFDPLGWLSPFVLKTKLMMQHLWLAKVSWDEEISEELQRRWRDIKSGFEEIKLLQIPRLIGPNTTCIEVHGFSDASELAYAACVYFRTTSNNKISTNLVTSKSKVAPIQSVSLPRLELCGSHLLAELVTNVCQAFELTTIPIYLWSDSTVVLSWLKSGPPKKWKVYVANRTAEIHKLLPNVIWRHVNSGDNPSDLATRGIKPSRLLSNELWWKGPKWLFTRDASWPHLLEFKDTEAERRTNVIGLQLSPHKGTNLIEEMVEKTSKWTKLVRVFSIIQRYVYNLRNPKAKKFGSLSLEELTEAETAIIRQIQQIELASDISNLESNKQLNKKSVLLTLSPFIDQKSLLRVRGHLENATCSYATKQPLIIPKRHKISNMILNQLHVKHLHPGPSLLVSLSRLKYWILGVRQTARSVSRKCIICFRRSSNATPQLMGNLPYQRVTPSRPLNNK